MTERLRLSLTAMEFEKSQRDIAEFHVRVSLHLDSCPAPSGKQSPKRTARRFVEITPILIPEPLRRDALRLREQLDEFIGVAVEGVFVILHAKVIGLAFVDF